MEIIRIPNRFHKQISRLKNEEQLWLFHSLFILSSGENIQNKDSFAGDILEQIWRECILMDKKNGKHDRYAVCELPAVKVASNPHAKVKESKVKESKVNISFENFEKFWNEYPKKTGKKKCLDIFVKKNPDINICLKTLEWQKKTQSWRDGYIPNPETWLNQERWNDEPAEIKKVGVYNPFEKNEKI